MWHTIGKGVKFCLKWHFVRNRNVIEKGSFNTNIEAINIGVPKMYDRLLINFSNSNSNTTLLTV